jgi:hypothetical protein
MYKVIRKAISKELAEFCYDYFRLKRKVARLFFKIGYISAKDVNWGRWGDSQIPDTYSHYSDIAMETLLVKLQSLMEAETAFKLNPAYSYARIYKNGDVLARHTDRPDCKFSTTLNLGGDPWPIFLEPSGKKEKKGIRILLEAGDMLIYDGVTLEHWREKFEGEICCQVFLHYTTVEKKYNGRPFLGLPQCFRE